MTRDELDQCVVEYEKDVFSFCRYLTGNREDANDLFQDTFLTFIQKHKELDRDQNVKGYLLSIAIGINKNRIRKIAWRNRIAPSQAIMENDTPLDAIDEQTPLTKVLEDEQARLIKEMVRALPEKYKIVILLYYMEEQTTPQIASILKIPQGTVLSRLHQAKKILKKELMDQEIVDVENAMDTTMNGGLV